MSKKKLISNLIFEKEKKKKIPFDQREKISSLSLLFIIVNKNQGNYFVTEFQKRAIPLSIVLYASSLPPEDIRSILSVDSLKKEMVISIIRDEDKDELFKIIKNRFSISKTSKGIAFLSKIDSVSGILTYKYLSDYIRRKKEVENNIVADDDQYELVIAIVNKGATDLVMEGARKQGATGGTILVARGTGNPDLAKMYGVVIQPEKEVVFIVVKKEIKDAVMKEIYDDAGLDKKSQGIILSLPISKAYGLFENDEKKA